LLKKGLNPNATFTGNTALMHTKSKSNAGFLIKYGADTSLINNEGKTAYEEKGLTLVLEEEIKQGLTIGSFHSAVKRKVPIKKIFINNQQNVKNVIGENILTMNLNDDEFENLITLGVDVNNQNIDGETCLFTLTKNNELSKIKFLIDKIDLNLQEKNGYTALMYMAERNTLKKEYILKTVDLSLKNNEGMTLFDILDKSNPELKSAIEHQVLMRELNQDEFKSNSL